MARRERTGGLAPALVASLALHALVLTAVVLFGVLFKKPRMPGGGVPVTIVTNGPPELIRAPESNTPQEAQAEELAEVPEEVFAEDDPLPDPVRPKPTAKPAPSPTGKGKPSPPSELDFDRLLEDVQGAKKGRSKPPATKLDQPQSAATVKVGSGKRLSGAAKGYLLTLGDELGRRWRPNCYTEGASKVTVTLRFTVGPGGLVKKPEPPRDFDKPNAEDAAYIAARRAVFAAKFEDFPPELYGEELIVPFDASVVCGRR